MATLINAAVAITAMAPAAASGETFLATPDPKSAAQAGQEGTMIDRDGLRFEFHVRTPDVRHPGQLLLEADITNIAPGPMRLDARLLDAPSLVLRFRRTEPRGDIVAVPVGPPPMPSAPDDVSGLRELRPGQAMRFVYDGGRIFGGQALPTGDYAVRLVYDKPVSRHDEWHGYIETDWLPFRLDPM